jgi:hypothetical protein
MFREIFVSTEVLFIFYPKLNFETRIGSKIAKHENLEIVFFRIALVNGCPHTFFWGWGEKQ